jgi:hypothetical protein
VHSNDQLEKLETAVNTMKRELLQHLDPVPAHTHAHTPRVQT